LTEDELYRFFAEHHIQFQRFSHPPVYTVEQADLHMADKPGARTKNLFVRAEKKEQYFLVWTLGNKRVDFKRLGKTLGIGNPRFGSPEKMLEFLGIEPGAVTVLALINDFQHNVQLIIDRDLWQSPSFQSHPLVNTATLILAREDVQAFFDLTGHTPLIIEVPEKVEI
jgi:Ala-tRNA(Pro) deacylase